MCVANHPMLSASCVLTPSVRPMWRACWNHIPSAASCAAKSTMTQTCSPQQRPPRSQISPLNLPSVIASRESTAAPTLQPRSAPGNIAPSSRRVKLVKAFLLPRLFPPRHTRDSEWCCYEQDRSPKLKALCLIREVSEHCRAQWSCHIRSHALTQPLARNRVHEPPRQTASLLHSIMEAKLEFFFFLHQF